MHKIIIIIYQANILKESDMRIEKARSPVIGWIGGVFFLIFIIWGIFHNIALNNRIEQPGDVIDLRDGNIITIRLPKIIVPFQTVHIYEAGYAIRIVIPEHTDSTATRAILTSSEQKALEQFRQQWCMSMPEFGVLQPNEPYYDVGVRCGGSTVKQVKVPLDMLPSTLDAILRRLPPLPTPPPLSA